MTEEQKKRLEAARVRQREAKSCIEVMARHSLEVFIDSIETPFDVRTLLDLETSK